MAKKSKKKTASKKGAKKIKFNKDTQYEVDYVWVEPANTLKQTLVKVWAKISAFIKDALP
jgi:hypothetical protein